LKALTRSEIIGHNLTHSLKESRTAVPVLTYTYVAAVEVDTNKRIVFERYLST